MTMEGERVCLGKADLSRAARDFRPVLSFYYCHRMTNLESTPKFAHTLANDCSEHTGCLTLDTLALLSV